MRTASCRRPSRRRRRPSGRRTGCATTTTSSRIRCARFGRTCRASTTWNCPSSPTVRSAGYPRVYAFARELITHTAGRLDLQTLVDFATAYQRAAPLTIGEIWAIPIMLRLGAGRRAAPARRRCRRGAPQSRSRARLGRAAEYRRRRRPNGSSTRCCATRRRRADACRPPSSSSCCTGCAISPRRPRRRGTRCSARSKARATRPTRCCASSTSAKPPGSSPSGTSSRRCGCCRRSTGRSSSSASASSSRCCARIRPAPTRGWTFRPAIATATRSRNWRGGTSVRARRRARRRSIWRPARSDDAPDQDRTHHVGYYLISRGRFRLERDGRLPADAARSLRALLLRPSGPRLSRHDRRRDRARRGQLRRLRAPARRRHGRPLADGVRRAAAAERAGDQPDQSRRHVAGLARASCRSSTCGRASPPPIARWSSCRRSSIPRRG